MFLCFVVELNKISSSQEANSFRKYSDTFWLRKTTYPDVPHWETLIGNICPLIALRRPKDGFTGNERNQPKMHKNITSRKCN